MNSTRLRYAGVLLAAAGFAALVAALRTDLPNDSPGGLAMLAGSVGAAAMVGFGFALLLRPARPEPRWPRRLLAVAATLGLAAVMVRAWPDIAALRALRSRGVAANAQIVTIQTVGANPRSGTIDYAFKVGDSVVMGQIRLLRSEYSHVRMGAPLSVTYLPSDPHTFRLGRVDASLVRRHLLLWLLALARPLAMFALPLVNPARRAGSPAGSDIHR